MERGRLAQSGVPLEIVENPASEFVREFVGREAAGLKSLALRKVSERLQPGDGAAGEPIEAAASLRDALAAMTARRTDRLPVVDAAGNPAGVITLADLVR
jgi:osmoprotectant transport system ATP-binding protein